MPPVRKIAKWPPEMRQWLERAFIERAFGDIKGITNDVNKMLAKAGIEPVGKSAVGEESQRVRQAQEAIAAATRSMQLIADSARDDADKRGEAINALVSQHMFEALLDASAAGAEKDPAKRMALLNKAALAAGRLTTTSVRQRAFRHLVEERAKAAADAVTKIAKTGGLKPAQLREIKAQIMGVASTPAHAQNTASTKAPAGRQPHEDPATTA